MVYCLLFLPHFLLEVIYERSYGGMLIVCNGLQGDGDRGSSWVHEMKRRLQMRCNTAAHGTAHIHIREYAVQRSNLTCL